MINKKVEALAEKILNDLGVGTSLPIPVEKVARSRGLDIKPYDLGENVSGVLVIDGGKGTIGINPTESKVRQRFTIAHELGHYELHRHDSDLFIDNGFKVIFRNEDSSKGEIRKEQEANAFAASLLMPAHLVEREIEKYQIDLNDEDSMKTLAKAFDVSVAAITIRITNLNH